VLPTDQASVVLRPLGTESVRIHAGFWADRQRINREVSIPAGHDELERAGNFDNLRIVAGRAAGSYRGRIFNDSDIYKWLEAVGWELAREHSPDLERLAEETIELIEAAQDDDGYLNSYYTIAEPEARFSDPQEGHELYCAGHLMQAAIAHARGTGNKVLLGVAQRFADHLDARFGPGRQPYVEGHPEIEMALVELFRVTGESRYLDLACHFIDQRGHGSLGPGSFGSEYFQDHEPVRSATTVAGHAVRALYLAAGVTDACVEAGDRSLMTAMTTQWEDMVFTKTYLTGGVGSRHKGESFGDPYELPPDRAYCETCAAISSIMWSWRLLLTTGEARYADLIERTLYNGFASSTSLDGRAYYYCNPLQIRSDHEVGGVDNLGAAERKPWYNCACCPPNIMRLISSLSHYLASYNADGVQLHQYTTSTIRTAQALGPQATLHVRTDYPWDGRIDVSIEESSAQEWTLSMRVPSWSERSSVTVNGDAARLKRDARGYVSMRREWRAGDVVSLEFDMSARLVAPDPRIDAVRGCVAIERGPLVYCLEETDLPAGVALDDVRLGPGPELTATRRPDLLGGITTVEAVGLVRRVDGAGWPYPNANASGDGQAEAVTLTAIPYYAWANRSRNAMRVWVAQA
jgi:DUF1680 family protein